MTSLRENIMAYVATTLAATAGVSGNVFRSRPEALSRAEAPAVLIWPVQDTADYSNMDYLEWNLDFRVTVITRGLAPDSLADPIVNSIHALLMADRTLGGRCMDILPKGVFFKVAEGDNPIGVTDILFGVRHRTSAASLET